MSFTIHPDPCMREVIYPIGGGRTVEANCGDTPAPQYIQILCRSCEALGDRIANAGNDSIEHGEWAAIIALNLCLVAMLRSECDRGRELERADRRDQDEASDW